MPRITRAEKSYRKSTLKSLGPYVSEHFPNAAYGVYPIESDSKLAIIIVSNKYSPNNFWYVADRSLQGERIHASACEAVN